MSEVELKYRVKDLDNPSDKDLYLSDYEVLELYNERSIKRLSITDLDEAIEKLKFEFNFSVIEE